MAFSCAKYVKKCNVTKKLQLHYKCIKYIDFLIKNCKIQLYGIILKKIFNTKYTSIFYKNMQKILLYYKKEIKMASASCLGLYIEEHLIKYAKVSKEHEKIKVESFGIKFYDKIGPAIDQVIQETYSQRTPISVNISEEMYNYFDMFALLSKNDLQKAVSTEFESFCTEKGYNPNVFESRYAVVEDLFDKEKIKVLHIAENKIELNKRMQQIDGYKLVNMSPISVSIPNLIDTSKNENIVVVNVEEKTTITTIMKDKIYNVETLEEGSNEILSKINLKENSYSKAYEICKNTTIYTSEGKELQQEESTYLEDIMPTVYNIVSKVMKIINSTTEKINKVYITGTVALINNIDLYFQEYLTDVECQILKPYFIENTRDISVKDYIEVNSAISMALMGIGDGISGMNFKKQTFLEKIPDWLKIEVTPKNEKNSQKEKKYKNPIKMDLGERLDKTEIGLVRIAGSLALLVIIYSVFSIAIGKQMNQKENEALQSIETTKKQITLANKDDEKIKTRINNYSKLIENIEEANNKITERNKTRNAIPNLLNQIMTIVPEKVQITSIENTSDTHIVINAQSNKYEQLGYLKTRIKTEAILTNVFSTAGQKNDGVVTVKIEGDLP